MTIRDLIAFGLGPAVAVAGAADWTDDEKKQIRQALGVTGVVAATSGTGNLDLVLADTGELQTDWHNGGRLDLLLDIAAARTGSSSKVYTVTVGGVPRANAYCRLCTDAACTVTVADGTSNSIGQVTFWHNLPALTNVWVHTSLDGYGTLIDAEVI
jgi:hypothetical protein